jgi:hypothetical protein
MEVDVDGASTVWLDMHGEVYKHTCPRIRVQFLPFSGNELVGTSTMVCVSSGLEATTIFKPKAFFGTVQGQVTGHIRDVRSGRILFHITGAFNRSVFKAFEITIRITIVPTQFFCSFVVCTLKCKVSAFKAPTQFFCSFVVCTLKCKVSVFKAFEITIRMRKVPTQFCYSFVACTLKCKVSEWSRLLKLQSGLR